VPRGVPGSGSAVLAALALVGGLVVAGCSDSPRCGDLESLNEELANTGVDDPGYNDLVSQAKRAEADCNKGGGY
jgi:hypothetical protein